MKILSLVVLAFIMSTPLVAQWAKVPPAAIPRGPDGKPNLSAPAPRLPDGTPDLSGVWNPPLGYVRNLARDLKEEVPFQAWARKLYDDGLRPTVPPEALNRLPNPVPVPQNSPPALPAYTSPAIT